jgi:hypothetical protein
MDKGLDIDRLVWRFGGGETLARKLYDLTGERLSGDAIAKWVSRKRIPGRWHLVMLELARKERVPLTPDQLRPKKAA